jgi:hypothetical protein
VRFFIAYFIALTAYSSDTITFSSYQTPKLYNYSYSYDRDDDRDDDRDYDFDNKYRHRDDKYNYGHPSIPEPSTWSLLFGLCALSAALIQRYKKTST